jgi:hypothetical protein
MASPPSVEPPTERPADDGSGDAHERSAPGAADDRWDTDLDTPLDWGRPEPAAAEPVMDDADLDDDDVHGVGEPTPPSPDAVARARRRAWRRRRRLIGTLVFLVVVGGLGLVIARTAGVGKGGGQRAAATSTTRAPSTTTTLPPAGPYRVLDGLNVRSGPGPGFPAVGTVRFGDQVMVICVADGPVVNGPNGQTTKWLKVTTPLGPVFVTAAFVAVGADLADPTKIAVCPTG